jgi:hypothetical protein
VQLSVKYETVLNMTTAKALGLDVPTSILLSADELIEREYRNARRLDRRRQQWVRLGHSATSAQCPERPQADMEHASARLRLTVAVIAAHFAERNVMEYLDRDCRVSPL